MSIVAIAKLRSIAPYQQGRYSGAQKCSPKESADALEHRTWRERCHYDPITRKVFIPPMAFKKALENAARMLGTKIPGKRNATYTKHFLAGILVTEPLELPITVDEIPGTWLFVPSDGKAGGGSRVSKCFPTVASWEGTVKFHILDGVITKDVFDQHLREAGSLVGIGVFRPEKGGYQGRFVVDSLEWIEKE